MNKGIYKRATAPSVYVYQWMDVCYVFYKGKGMIIVLPHFLYQFLLYVRKQKLREPKPENLFCHLLFRYVSYLNPPRLEREVAIAILSSALYVERIFFEFLYSVFLLLYCRGDFRIRSSINYSRLLHLFPLPASFQW